MKEETRLILKAYELTERVTPMKHDCGRLCSSACCGGDGKTGMQLFPGEEELFKQNGDFRIYESVGNFGCKIVVCGGVCDRRQRPLACRIFPYFPLIRDEAFDARADIRAVGVCPLLKKNIKPDYAFIRQVRLTARLFSQNDTLRAYLESVNEMLDEITLLAQLKVDCVGLSECQKPYIFEKCKNTALR